MSFVLRVTHGANPAEEFVFDDEARLGRTADNDIVIKDPQSSRSHARVYLRKGRCYIEDLGSANGTQLNGETIEGVETLAEGDVLSIGEVEIEFSAVEKAPVKDTFADLDEDELPPVSAATLDEVADERSRLETVERMPNSLARRPSQGEYDDENSEPSVGSRSTRSVTVPPPRALSRRADSKAMLAGAPVMTAAERARERRALEKSAWGRAELYWQSLSKPVRLALVSVVSLLVVAGLAVVGLAAFPTKVQTHIEPVELGPNADPIAESFGLGDDVTFERADLKSFTFSYSAPTRAVGVLHYQATNISNGEVAVELNGADVGTIPPDTLDTETRELEVVLSAQAVKVGEPNVLVFDNVNNPPGNETWKVWNIWVEVNPIPEMTPEEAARRAGDDVQNGNKYYELRDVGAENLFRAWKAYRDAWLVLEATPNRPAAVYEFSKTRMREIRPELDRKCIAMLVEYKKVMNVKTPDLTFARKLLADIPTSFPTREHPCHTLSKSLLRDLDDEGEGE